MNILNIRRRSVDIWEEIFKIVEEVLCGGEELIFVLHHHFVFKQKMVFLKTHKVFGIYNTLCYYRNVDF